MPTAITFLSMSKPGDSFSSTCKVFYSLLVHVDLGQIVFHPCFWSFNAGEAEAGLERLHQCAEKELQNYLHSEGPSVDFNDFRTKLAGLTR